MAVKGEGKEWLSLAGGWWTQSVLPYQELKATCTLICKPLTTQTLLVSPQTTT